MINNSIRGKIAVAGIGEVPTGKYPDRDFIEAALMASREAILDAGIKKDEIDVVMPTGVIFNRHANTDMVFSRMIDELGLQYKAKNNLMVFNGGSSSSTMLETAGSMIISGLAKVVLCVHTDRLATGIDINEAIDLFATLGISAEFEVPYGLNFSAVAGLITQRYMYETGTTEEEIASVCVSNRKWAELNKNAMFRKPLTIDEVLKSKILSSPLHAKESNVLADGAAAFIVTSWDYAKKITKTPIALLGTGSVCTHYSLAQERDVTRAGYDVASRKAYEMAGVTAKDIDIAEIYDSYPVWSLLTLEGCGLCNRGEAGKFVKEGNTWPGGKLPMTTNGGMLSQGHTGAGGGFAVFVETIRQLMGKAGERQVKNCNIALETSVGGTYMDAYVSVLGTKGVV